MYHVCLYKAIASGLSLEKNLLKLLTEYLKNLHSCHAQRNRHERKITAFTFHKF